MKENLSPTDLLNNKNKSALAAIKEFRAERTPEQLGIIDSVFHKYKNRYPYFGFVDVVVEDQKFMMFCGNDDLVALTFLWYGPSSYEQQTLKIWITLAKDSDTILDIGSFSGLFTLAALTANPDARAVAFEPSRRTHGRLLLNLFANGVQNRAVARAVGLSDEPGEARLLQFRGENILGNGASLLTKEDRPVVDGTEIVHVETVDAECDQLGVKPDLVKIDVESAEVQVLTGMQNVLEDSRPRCLIEVTPETFVPARKVLENSGYEVWLVDDTKGALVTPDSAPRQVSMIFAERR